MTARTATTARSTKKRAKRASISRELALFKRMAHSVPAYKKFLHAAAINPEQIRTATDLSHVPSVDKENYLRAYPYKDLFWNGSLLRSHIMTSTSGSTGEPVYFARSHEVDEQSSLIHEKFFIGSSLSKTKPTLAVICFGMGVWIGGIITYQALEIMGKRGYPISVITPGINKAEILKILKRLAPEYEQIILAGYPPFIKDIVDEAHEQGIGLTNKKTAIIFAAEAFTEHFRNYIAAKAGVANVLTDTMNIYGSADLGTMAFETPLSILVRRLALKKPELFTDLFGGIIKTPTLAQYIPQFTSFEEKDGQLLVTGDSAMPLFRYDIGDNGGTHTFEDIAERFRAHGINLSVEMRLAKVPRTSSQLPFVHVYERADLSTTLYGLQIYPETIREILLEEIFVPFLTGRVTLVTKFNETHDQYLEINIELCQGKEASKSFHSHLAGEIVRNLKTKNGEYRELSNFLGERAEPHLVFWPHEDPLYFRRDIKQKWVIRTEK